MRVLLTLSYDGTDFCGYQVQPNGRSVEQVLNDAIFALTGERVKSVSSGRTDSGVHAYAQTVHFDTNSTIPAKNFALALNPLLPSDVKVLKSKKVSGDFHARYGAKSKTYRYSFYVSQTENPMFSRYKSLIKQMPNVEKMKECCKVIEGTHDFKCFMASGSSVKDTTRTVYSVKITKRGSFLDITVKGNGFLYNMVRIIAGTLLAVGENKLLSGDVARMIETGDRPVQAKTAEARGLALIEVKY
ncbi:MAG: tRNA pseudouridine(38-40) synthase TruA [Clostridia bacterium]|nr:tRNA pseudouridine(38-40) synthase TruA [Clostridia bacterium]